MQQTGAATAEEVGIASLVARPRDDDVAHNGTMVMSPFIGAWTLTGLA